MKKWQKERNYRRVRDKDKKVIANIITIDGIDVEVTEEVFRAYSQMDRRERYLEEQVWKSGMREVSLEYLKEQGISLNLYAGDNTPSAEDVVLEKEEQHKLEVHKAQLITALAALTADEKQLIQTLYFNEVPIREYARKIGVSDMAIHKRKERILKEPLIKAPLKSHAIEI